MKIAVVIQRYGVEILGGSEYHCRLVVERLARRHQVEVITTCATSYITWANEYPEGTDRVRGITVRRFPTAVTRDIEAFNHFSDWIFNNPHRRSDEIEWLRQQGPWSPALIDYLQQNHGTYDALIFFTYLYAPTVLGLPIAPARSILVPTAHDEPAIHLGIYADMFRLPAAIAYNTEVERGFLKATFPIQASIEETVGCGVELPPVQGAAKARGLEGRAGTNAPGEAGDSIDDQENADRDAGRSSKWSRGATFRRRHRLQAPLMLYGGRIDPGKGCEELIEYFSAYVAEGGEGTLALMGLKLMPLPEVPHIRFAGLLSEQERFQALEAATVVIVPSPYESLSLLALEAFAVGTPILANARSDVLVDHCVKSNAGLFYAEKAEFVECLKLLVAEQPLREAMGRNGREYVRANYRWDVILGKYDRMITRLRGAAVAG
jgi:glycosyltransferase involved in cell wall biosynthesis